MAAASTACRDAKTRIASVEGERFAYRFMGDGDAAPLVLLNHWGANLDNFDPAVVDPLATGRLVPELNCPVTKRGALSPIMSAYCRDPDGNLVELSSYPATYAGVEPASALRPKVLVRLPLS